MGGQGASRYQETLILGSGGFCFDKKQMCLAPRGELKRGWDHEKAVISALAREVIESEKVGVTTSVGRGSRKYMRTSVSTLLAMPRRCSPRLDNVDDE